MSQLGERGLIFMPAEVYNEIEKTEDDLLEWVNSSKIKIVKTDTAVLNCIKRIYDTNPIHERLVDSANNRSLADPWVIAHAMSSGACVVTKEHKVTASANKVKIPNVCENMGVRWINDFEFGRELNIKFTCSI